MITGKIDENFEPRMTLRVRQHDRHEDVEFLVDTGFNGFIAIPISLVRRLRLQLGAVQSGITADGRSGYFDTVSIELLWHEVPISVRAQVLDEPLIGTRLLRGNSLSADWIVGGSIRISPLSG
jgi:clan AA aspartic protease